MDADAASVAEPQLTIDDDAIASSKSFGNHGHVVDGAIDPDEPQLDGRIWLDYENVRPVLANLNCRAWDNQGVGLTAQCQCDVDKLTRPQPGVTVSESRLERNRAGRDVDLTIDTRSAHRLRVFGVRSGPLR